MSDRQITSDRITPIDDRSPLDRLSEPVRLVVWDLDETFWSGTLSEGGIRHREAHEEIVIELARRGIMSAICSRNDRAAVEAAFAGREVWRYFVFPRIDWEAKGPKLAALVEAVRLRPASVLFIDDNHLNREEAAHFVPGIGVADEHVVAHLLGHPLLAGKDDRELTRLAQYRLLEQRHAAARTAPDDVEAFLRDSGITVSIDYDVEANIDRAVELIQRTNQLNFTKQRLSGIPAEARAHLLPHLRRYDVQSGLVRVRDRYGDYGHVGFYFEQRSVHPGSGLYHFCFSCRILGLGVETWLYRRLGRPPIKVAGEVLVDLFDEQRTIDWITFDDAATSGDGPAAFPASEVALRGGCELLAISHYCRQLAPETYGDFAFNRDEIMLRLEHSMMAYHAIVPPPPEALDSFCRLGFAPEDFQSRMLTASADDAIWILSFWADPAYPLYRHKATGALIPFNASPATHQAQDLRTVTVADLRPQFREHWIVDAIAHLAEAYEPAGVLDEAMFKRNLGVVLGRMPPKGKVFIIGGNEWFPPGSQGGKRPRTGHVDVNRWTREVITDHLRVTFVDAADYIHGDGDVDRIHADHYAREVYFRIFNIVREAVCLPLIG